MCTEFASVLRIQIRINWIRKLLAFPDPDPQKYADPRGKIKYKSKTAKKKFVSKFPKSEDFLTILLC